MRNVPCVRNGEGEGGDEGGRGGRGDRREMVGGRGQGRKGGKENGK